MLLDTHLELLSKWAPYALNDIYKVPGRPELSCYGTGYDTWGVQTNQKAFSAFAALASSSSRPGLAKDELLETSHTLLNFSLESHIEGSFKCLDGRKWGHTWISSLGVERMMHGVEAIKDTLPKDTLDLLRRVLISEADWLMDNYEIVGGLDNSTWRNKPESNLWNGAVLHRVAAMFPDAGRAAEYKEKGSKFLINSISIPSDERSAAIVDGKAVSERFAGANFFESFSLDHHGYLNVGYMAICLSNAAMLHFFFKRAGLKPPEALHHHLKELWELVKSLCFPDGRLLRVGGDTRARYCYCQDYFVPSCIMAADLFNDADAPILEARWLEQVRKEMDHNADGSFLSARCAVLREASPLYYTRLESDRANSLSMGACWRKLFNIPEPAAERPESASKTFSWSEKFHGAAIHKDSERMASFVWRAAESPTALCLPADFGDMAEWRCNLSGETRGLGRKSWNETKGHSLETFKGGFMTCGAFVSRSGEFLAEGESDKALVLHHLAFAALPDSKTVVVLQTAHAIIHCHLKSIKGLHLLIPNDIFNGCVRDIALDGGKSRRLKWKPASGSILETKSRSLRIDGRLGAEIIYGADGFTIHSPAERQIGVKDKPDGGGMLHAIEICCPFKNGLIDCDEGETLFDIGAAIVVGNGAAPECGRIDCAEGCRAVSMSGADGVRYAFAANFGDAPAGLGRPFKDASPVGDNEFPGELAPLGCVLLRMA